MSYKKAPTWLYNMDGESELFTTQVKVDTAWEEGWFGPPNLMVKSPLASCVEWETKAAMKRGVEGDPRYEGLSLNVSRSFDELFEKLRNFEEEYDLSEVIVGKQQ